MPSEKPTREQVYDEKISQHMTAIIAICKEAGIPVFASFQLDDDLRVTTYIVKPVSDEDREFRSTFDAIAAKARAAQALQITTRDGSGNIKAIEVIL